ncbi:radical SAM protein [Clostridium bovifaecis]|uniref:Radical SAM protein n=1 Tax=Clostridium bovifaecis TaxID=2184719 RepID=A0A6I6EUR9_9CLOT|nr:radical SAM protein [Clostridium bovifaecis]
MIVSWNITKKCNLYCKHCYRDSMLKDFKDELTTEEGEKLIREIALSGFKILILSGGEPLMRKDLLHLISFARKEGLIPVLGTNGTLITEEAAKDLKRAGIMGAGISIDSAQEDKHDGFRQTRGSFKSALNGIENCLKEKIRVQINCTVTKDNKDEILDMVEFAKEKGASAMHPFFLVEVGRGKDMADKALREQEYISLIDDILDKQLSTDIELKPTCAPQFMVRAKKKGINMRFTRGCIAGIAYCCILPNGDVNICPYLQVKAGNVKEKSFYDIWKNSEVFNKLRNYDCYEGECGRCQHISICGGCRARAYKTTGDCFQEDPMCSVCRA